MYGECSGFLWVMKNHPVDLLLYLEARCLVILFSSVVKNNHHPDLMIIVAVARMWTVATVLFFAKPVVHRRHCSWTMPV